MGTLYFVSAKHSLILGSCLGSSFINSWDESLKSSTEKCFQERSLGEMPSLTSVLESKYWKKFLKQFDQPPQVPLRRFSHSSNALHNFGIKHLLDTRGQYNTYQTPFRQSTVNSPMFIVPIPANQQVSHANPFLSLLQPSKIPSQEKKFLRNSVWKRSLVDMENDTSKKQEFEEINDKGTLRNNRRGGKTLHLYPQHRGGAAADAPTLWEISSMREQLGNRISNITCVLRSMELLDENNVPNYSFNTQLINHLKIPEQLRSTFLDVHEFCKEFSMCVPVHKMSDIMFREMGYSLVFLKCMKKKIFRSCITYDMNKESNDHSFSSSAVFFDSLLKSERSSYASRGLKLFEETPSSVAKNVQNLFISEDEVSFGF